MVVIYCQEKLFDFTGNRFCKKTFGIFSNSEFRQGAKSEALVRFNDIIFAQLNELVHCGSVRMISYNTCSSKNAPVSENTANYRISVFVSFD